MDSSCWKGRAAWYISYIRIYVLRFLRFIRWHSRNKRLKLFFVCKIDERLRLTMLLNNYSPFICKSA